MYKIMFVVLGAAFLLGGCTNSKTADDSPQKIAMNQQDNDSGMEEKLFQAVKIKVNEKYQFAQDLKITDVLIEGNSGFANLVFDLDHVMYEGCVYAYQENSEWKVDNFDLTPIDSKSHFTIHQVSGGLHDNPQQTYLISAGYLNDERISEIHLDYSQTGLMIIKVGAHQKTYFDTKQGVTQGSLEVKGYDEKGNEIIRE
ncbi:hypothetical protein [Tumebacillus flagellatus]|uniref:Lipoprotein n=1 Tax=Tumebacillus flagellatus TaxID=1157490 RepID=A0A074LMG2_9BACL|nr:hypothetical protein [Tumebacillus flagellatus]KEO81685.1 hypothetical protein EL26_19635 [Tumebacillus flagellatus]